MRKGDIARRLVILKLKGTGGGVGFGAGGEMREGSSCERQRCCDRMMTVESAGFAGEDL